MQTAWAVVLALASPALAAREPVLKQVDLPHPYYWRELYVPQLTAGPSSLAFTPDGKSLIYSMGGSLWRQVIGAEEAVELTHPAGAYDYQPDVAPDGASVVFTRYDGGGFELMRLDLASGRAQALTNGGAVNLEPRLSPDGRRIAFVSTQGTGRFNLFIADIGPGGLTSFRPLVAPRRSQIARYYYSPFDHAINSSWSPDGRRVYFVGNPEIALGTGDIWSVAIDDPSDRKRVLSEETSWSARPEVAPDGKRVLFSSYHGRQWQQLWLTTPGGAPALPLTFGDFDRRAARWSPDGSRIAFIANDRDGVRLVMHEVVGGAETAVTAARRRYLAPHARLTLQIEDEKGRWTPARVAILGSDGRAAAPDGAWMHGDDGFDRTLQKTETHYFHCAVRCTVTLPAGPASVWVQRGFRYRPWRTHVSLAAGSDVTVPVKLEPNDLPPGFGTFRSADLHVHMNYGGTYRNTPENLARQARAEDLDVVYNLIVNKEQRVPDVAYFRPDPDPASGDGVTILHAQEFHTSFWGHLGLLHLADHLITPDFAAYQASPIASPWPHNGVIADLAHAQGALVGYVHPLDARIDPATEPSLSSELPADVALGKVDYIEVMGFSDHKATAEVWYRLLNLGFRLPTGAGTDAMANYASLRGPVGMNRVFVDTGGDPSVAALKRGLKAGRTFASNGPLLGLDLAGAHPGDTLRRAGPGKARFRVALRSPVAVEHLELVANGKVVRVFDLGADHRRFDAEGEIALDAGGWLLLRAWNDGADPQVLDLYPYATTSPVWLDLPGGPQAAPADAAYFVKWMDRVIEAAGARDDYNTIAEKRDTLAYLAEARDRFRAMAAGAAP